MIRALPGDRVFAVQMNDGPRQPQLDDYKQDCMANRVPPGEGEFDCVAFVRLLAEIGVRAPISLEVCSTELWAAPAAEAARRAADGMRAVLAEAAAGAPLTGASRQAGVVRTTRRPGAADALGEPARGEGELDVLDLVPLVHDGAVGDPPLPVPALEAVDVAAAEGLQHDPRSSARRWRAHTWVSTWAMSGPVKSITVLPMVCIVAS